MFKKKDEGVPDLLGALEDAVNRAKAARAPKPEGEVIPLSPVEQDLAELAGGDGPEAA